MWLPTLAAVGLHVSAGAWWLSQSGGATAAGQTTTLTMPVTLVRLEPNRSGDASPPPLPPALPAVSGPPPVQRAAALPEQPPARMLDTSARDKASAPRASAAPRPVGAEASGMVFGTSETLEPAYLAGEPLIKLGDDEASMNGSIALHLSIDDTGHVVDGQLSSQDGLPESAVVILVRAFTGYVYVPARRGGRPVRSDVTMVISVRDGQGVSTQSP